MKSWKKAKTLSFAFDGHVHLFKDIILSVCLQDYCKKYFSTHPSIGVIFSHSNPGKMAG